MASFCTKINMETPDNDKAPLFKNWNYWYALVIGVLVLIIILFYFFTKNFS
jgi:Mg2+ and Co2+ transporter CorA